MIEELSNPFYADGLWLAIAFLCGIVVKRFGLPPLIGFLVAGFLINASGLYQANLYSSIQYLADIGVMLLLFTIGLKLKLKSLLKKEIWATASLHMLIIIVILASLLTLLSYTGLSFFTELNLQSRLMISFALSFSSTVFVVKTLESRGEFESYHGKLAIGILIIQDIFAVLFIALSDKELPSPWVFALPFALLLLQKILYKLLDFLEHGEMVPVFGFFATFIAGALSFSVIDLKPDLGALIIGMLLVNHPRANELYDRMVEYKDFFLIAFFINVGLTGLPSASTVVAAFILLPIILLKGGLFLAILSRFKLQPRTAYLGSLTLSNFSEFGLIVGVVGLNMGLISEEWLVILALLMSASFIAAAPINKYSHLIFDRYKDFILKLNNYKDSEDAEPKSFGNAKYLVVGLGSVGKPAYETLHQKFGNCTLGLDYNKEVVDKLSKQDKNVKWADTTDSELWDNVDTSKLAAIFLTMSDPQTNNNTLEQIQKIKNRSFKLFTICHFEDHKQKYLDEGVDFVFDYKNYLGKDFVNEALASKENQ